MIVIIKWSRHPAVGNRLVQSVVVEESILCKWVNQDLCCILAETFISQGGSLFFSPKLLLFLHEIYDMVMVNVLKF